jgi:hypothetical protein
MSSDPALPSPHLIEYAAIIVQAYVGNNRASASDVAALVKDVHATLTGLIQPGSESAVTTQKPAVPVKKSITPEYVICLEDGKKLKMLKRTHSLRASLAANTSIKMAAGVSMSDARAMAPDLRTTPEFILSQPKLHFACHIRNVTPQAVSVPVPVGVLEDQPTLSRYAFERLLESNRVRVSLPKEVPEGTIAITDDDPVGNDAKFNADHDPTKPSSEW